jgi:drug/metabolite transporter (DMT)-like permease
MPLLGETAALVTALFWSGSSIAFASATARVGSVQVNISRLLLAVLYLTLVVALLPLHESISVAQWSKLAVSGVIGLAIGDSFLFKAYREMGARISMLMMSLAPAFAGVLGFFFLSERMSVQGLAGMAVTLLGIILVILQSKRIESGTTRATGAGVVFALVGAVAQAVNLLFVKMAFQEGPINGFVATLIRILASLVIILPFAVLSGRWKNPVKAYMSDIKAFWQTVVGSILGPFLGISASLLAVAHTSIGVASTLMATVPVLMLPLVRLVSKERLSWRSVAGACVAVAGVAILFLR